VNRETLRVAVVAVLCIAALGAAAATLDSTVATGGGSGPADAGGSGFDDDPGGAPVSFDDGAGGGGGFGGGLCWPFLTSPEFFALVALVGGAVFGVVAWRHDATMAAATVVAVAMPGFLLWLLLASCNGGVDGESLVGVGGGNNSSMAQGGGSFGPNAGEVAAAPSLLVLGLLAVVLLAAVAAVVVGSGDETVTHEEEASPGDDEERRAAIGEVAGQAADRIAADGDVDNEVFRAWRRMVELLAVEDPDTTTPGEYEPAAVAAGVDADDAAELTGLFEAVRYGDATPTGDREDRAVAALRRIEDEYAGDGGEDW
jgi:hypothetical protein